jgi:hypothetical protein
MVVCLRVWIEIFILLGWISLSTTVTYCSNYCGIDVALLARFIELLLLFRVYWLLAASKIRETPRLLLYFISGWFFILGFFEVIYLLSWMGNLAHH